MSILAFQRAAAGAFLLLATMAIRPTLAQAKSVPHLANEFTTKAAMELLFGGFNDIDGYSEWRAKSESDEVLRAYPILNAAYMEQGTPRHMLVVGSRPENEPARSCHACRTLISAVLFSRIKGVWTVSAKNLYLVRAGEFGETPHIELQHLSSDHFGFRLDQNFTGGGIGKMVEVFDISQSGFHRVFSAVLDSHFDFGPCSSVSKVKAWEECAEFDGGISFIKGDRNPYFDILLARRVSRSASTQIRRGLHVLHYQYIGNKYLLKEQAAPQQMPL